MSPDAGDEDMKKIAKKMTVCSRGHKFLKSAAQPVCPICWPGRYEKKKK